LIVQQKLFSDLYPKFWIPQQNRSFRVHKNLICK